MPKRGEFGESDFLGKGRVWGRVRKKMQSGNARAFRDFDTG